MSKNKPQHHPHLQLKKTKSKGVGVFAKIDLKEGDLIEKAPVLMIPEGEIGDEDELSNYVFGTADGEDALVLGFGSLYNHSYQPNVSNVLDGEYMVYTALKDISAGEELTINYNGDPDDQSTLWFDVED